jgi:HK97 family phage major capsid protein/HK97 family phage prohead protease
VDRAYALLHVKAFDAPTRTFTGIATTPTPDRLGDVIDPLGVTFKNPLPLLWHHDKTQPIGTVTFDPPTPDGITFTATIPDVAEAGTLKARLDEAWQSIKAGIISGVSIGYRALAAAKRISAHADGYRFPRVEVCELSLVTVPANADATILSIKTLDQAATGRPSASASRGVAVMAIPMKQTTAEQITAFENTRAAKDGRRVELMTKASEDGVTLDDAQTTEYDTLTNEIASVDAHLTRLRALELSQRSLAKPVVVTPEATRAASPVITVKANVPKGTGFTRYAMAMCATRGNRMEAIEYAKQWHDSTPEVELALKAAVAPGDTVTTPWAGALVPPFQYMADEFMALLRPQTILGKVPNLKRVPFRALVPKQTGGGSYAWVGQSNPKPATALQFGTVSLGITKIAGIVTLTTELVRLSSPSAEDLVRNDMIAGIAGFMDHQFIDPAVAPTGVNPASITNGIAGVPATTDPLADLTALITAFAAANLSLSQATFIMSEVNAFALSTRFYATGAREFPDLTLGGGSIFGVPVVTSQTAAQWIILVYGPGILYADDGGVTIDVSMEASVQMNSTPDDPTTATTVLVSLWQNNLVGLRAERFCNWTRGRDEGVAYLTGAQYAPAAPITSRGATPGNGQTEHGRTHK